MATFNRFENGSHVTYQIVDTRNTSVILTPDEAHALLDWLAQQREKVQQDMQGSTAPTHEPLAGPPFMQSGDEYEEGDGPIEHMQ